MIDAIQQFKDAIRSAGLPPPEIIEADGNLHRFSTNGKRSDDAGYYVMHLDGIAAGHFGCWRSNVRQNWHERVDRKLSPAERATHRERIAETRRKCETEKLLRQSAAASKAAEILQSSAPAPDDHPYLTRKGIKANGARSRGDALAIPMLNGETLRSIQFIKPDGGKRFLKDGRVDGCYFIIGDPNIGQLLCIAEGFATGATIHEATGYPVAVAFNAGNLRAVSLTMRERFPALQLILCADDDHCTEGNPGLAKATVAARSSGALLAVPVFVGDRQEGQSDFNDMAAGYGLEAVRKAVESAALPVGSVTSIDGIDATEADPDAAEPQEVERSDHGAEEEVDRSQASLLVDFVRSRTELFHDQNRDAYARDRGTGETRRLDGRQFRDWLASSFYESTGKSPRDQSVREALSTLGGLARFKGECQSVFVRVAGLDGSYYLDLGEPGQSRAVRIDPGHWEIVTDPPVRFLRSDSLRPLPEPVVGGDISALWRIANVPTGARVLVIAWLGNCLRPDTPFPLLELIGEQGSAKSTTQAALRRLIDPNACDLRAAPKGVEDVFVSAGVNWLQSYENISHLTPQMQDGLCVLATGGGFAKRKLYSDADELVITVKRPVVLNGISVAVTAQDLVDRTISIETPVITERIETTSLWRDFDAVHGHLLGALLTVVADALARLPNIDLPPAQRPRLTEFARFGMAVAEAVGMDRSDFMKQFNASREEAIARTIDSSPVATAVIAWFEDRQRRAAVLSMQDLLTKIDRFKPNGTDAWPRSAKGLGDALRRIAPALRQVGIECRPLAKTGGTIRWTISATGNSLPQCPASPASPAQSDRGQDIRTFRTSIDVDSSTGPEGIDDWGVI